MALPLLFLVPKIVGAIAGHAAVAGAAKAHIAHQHLIGTAVNKVASAATEEMLKEGEDNRNED